MATETKRYIFCLTRMLLNSHNIFMSSCPGEESMFQTHCKYCEHWTQNQYIFEDDIQEGDDEE